MVQYSPIREMTGTTDLLLESAETQPLLKEVKGIGVRHFQVLLLFGVVVFEYMIRQCFAIVIVQMDQSEYYAVNMDSTEMALMLSSFSWGNGLLQIPLGAIGRKGKASILVGASLIFSCFLTMLLPLGALTFGVTGICILRFLTGLFQGALSANVFNLMSQWILPKEKDFLSCMINTAVALGSLLTSVISGYVGYNYDWPSICYFNGTIGLPWALLQMIAGAQDAEACTYISQEERYFMLYSFEKTQINENKAPHTSLKVPWRKMLTSGPVLALTVTLWCSNWCSWTDISLTPTYISGVLGFNLRANGFLSSLPFLAAVISGIFVAFFAPFLARITGWDDSFLQHMWNSLGQYGTCLCLMLLAFLPLDAMGAVTLLVVASGVSMFSIGGFFVSLLKIAPNFTGIISGICSTVANTAAIIGPLLSTYFLTDTSDLLLWRAVFLVAATIIFIGNTVFITWGSSKLQSWNEPEAKEDSCTTEDI